MYKNHKRQFILVFAMMITWLLLSQGVAIANPVVILDASRRDLNKAGITIDNTLEALDAHAVANDLTKMEVEQKLRKAGIEQAQVIQPAITSVAEDTSYQDPYYINNQAAYMQWMNTSWAWKTYRGAGVKIAVVDTGITASEPEFAGRLIQQYDFIDNDHIANDDYPGSHGTHVASVALAGMNGIKMNGAAPEAQLIAAKALGSSGGTTFVAAQAIIWAANQGAHVINLSFSAPGDPGDFMRNAIAYAHNMGASVICAAGNDGAGLQYPAINSNCITVGAVDKSGISKVDFSNYGAGLDVMAPGVDILGIRADGMAVHGSGTSFAAPLVSGLMALLREKHPQASVAALEAILINNTIDLGAPGYDLQTGAGLISFSKSLGITSNPWIVDPPSVPTITYDSSFPCPQISRQIYANKKLNLKSLLQCGTEQAEVRSVSAGRMVDANTWIPPKRSGIHHITFISKNASASGRITVRVLKVKPKLIVKHRMVANNRARITMKANHDKLFRTITVRKKVGKKYRLVKLRLPSGKRVATLNLRASQYTLPKLSRGTYRITVQTKGNAWARKSSVKTLRITL